MTVRGTGVRGFAKGRAFVVKDCGQRNPFEDIPPGSILVAERLSLSDSTLIDFRNVVGIATREEDAAGQVCVLAKGIGIPVREKMLAFYYPYLQHRKGNVKLDHCQAFGSNYVCFTS